MFYMMQKLKFTTLLKTFPQFNKTFIVILPRDPGLSKYPVFPKLHSETYQGLENHFSRGFQFHTLIKSQTVS